MGHRHDHNHANKSASAQGVTQSTEQAPSVQQPEGNAAAVAALSTSSETGDLGSMLDEAARQEGTVGAEGGKTNAEPNPSDPASHSEAESLNAKFHGIVHDIIKSSKDQPRQSDDRSNVLRNTAQWIDSGEASLHILTPTHDSHLREDVSGKQVALFRDGGSWRASGHSYAPYSADGSSTSGIVTRSRTARGGLDQSGTDLTLIRPLDKSDIEETLIHEVQHDADQHTVSSDDHNHGAFVEDLEHFQVDVDPHKAGSWVYNKYKTEFRAYWMGNDPAVGSAHGAPQNYTLRAEFGEEYAIASSSFKNRRQSDIFKMMRRMTGTRTKFLDPDSGWAHAYSAIYHYYAFDADFKKMVDSYDRPVGGNLVNSVRIQALSEALSSRKIDAVLNAAEVLDDVDRVFLSDRKQSGPFWTQVGRTLTSFDDIDALAQIIESPVRSGPTVDQLTTTLLGAAAVGASGAERTVTVEKGATLGDIAQRELGDASRWPEIYELNRDIIGNNPSTVRRGLVLVLP